ncbi:MAG: sigma-70 family RNA polymerase sigma factor [Acidobacteriota bacterium]
MSTLDAATGAALVRRITAGEEQAEAELIERSSGALRFLARRFARDEADAEDLYQETLILALDKIRRGEVREPERLTGFLRALVKNLSIQRYRRRRYEVEKPTDALPEASDAGQSDPLGSVLHRERARLTRRLLGELNVARDRDVLTRYYIGEESSRRICADLDIESEHFYRVLHRARQRYRRLWETRTDAR